MKKVLIALGIIAVLAVIVVASVGRRKTSGETVYAAEAGRGNIVTLVSGSGVIQPRTKVNISSEIYGLIVEIAAKEGQTVGKGALLVRIDPEKYRSEVDRLTANVRLSHIAIEAEEVNLKNLELEQKRDHELYRQQILSSREMERADLAVETSRIQLKSLRESVVQAEAALKRSKDDLGKATIFAPMAGKVTQVNTEVGEQVIVGTTNVPGSVMLVISDMSEVLAEVNVDETEVAQLAPGQKATLTVDAVEKTTYEGVVSEIRNTARREADVNVFGVKVLLKHPDERLRPGMTAKAKIEVQRKENVLRVPIQAVTTRERKKLAEEARAAGPAGGAIKVAEDRGATKQAASGRGLDVQKASEGGSAAGSGGTNTGAASDGQADAAAKEGSAVQSPSAEGGSDPGKRGAANETRAGEYGRSSSADTASADKGSKTEPAKGKDDRDEIEIVYVIEKDLVHSVPVKTGASEESYVEIRDGLEGGETVVTGPYRILKKLKDGDRVVKKDEKEAAEASDEKSEGTRSRRRSD